MEQWICFIRIIGDSKPCGQIGNVDGTQSGTSVECVGANALQARIDFDGFQGGAIVKRMGSDVCHGRRDRNSLQGRAIGKRGTGNGRHACRQRDRRQTVVFGECGPPDVGHGVRDRYFPAPVASGKGMIADALHPLRNRKRIRTTAIGKNSGAYCLQTGRYVQVVGKTPGRKCVIADMDDGIGNDERSRLRTRVIESHAGKGVIADVCHAVREREHGHAAVLECMASYDFDSIRNNDFIDGAAFESVRFNGLRSFGKDIAGQFVSVDHKVSRSNQLRVDRVCRPCVDIQQVDPRQAQVVAPLKCMVAHFGNGGRNRDGFHEPAIGKRIVGYAHDAVRQDDGLKQFIILKSALPDIGHAMWNRNGLQPDAFPRVMPVAISECMVADVRHAVGNRNGSQSVATVKRMVADI